MFYCFKNFKNIWPATTFTKNKELWLPFLKIKYGSRGFIKYFFRNNYLPHTIFPA